MSALDELLPEAILKKRPTSDRWNSPDIAAYDKALMALRDRWAELENAEHTAAANRRLLKRQAVVIASLEHEVERLTARLELDAPETASRGADNG